MNSKDNPDQTLTFGPLIPTDELSEDGFVTPEYVTVGTRVFYWKPELECYMDLLGIELYIEPGLNDHQQSLTVDSYWEYDA